MTLLTGAVDHGRLRISSRRRIGSAGSFNVLELVGRVDSENADTLAKELTRLAHVDAPVVVDCSRLAFVGSSGMRAFVRASRLATGPFRVAGLNPQVRAVFVATGIDRIVDLHESVDAALSAPA